MTQGQTTRRPSRGERNNNPGNIRHARGTKWQGAAAVQPDREFVAFVSVEMGIRALVRTLLTYHKQHKLKTVRGILNRWAPPIGDRNGPAPGGQYRQNTGGYIDAVCKEMGRTLGRTINADEALDVDSRRIMRPLVVAIIKHETGGRRYPDTVVDEGLRLAGIADAKPQPVASTGEVKGALISGTAIAAGGGLQLIQTFAEVRGQLEPVAHVSPILTSAVVLLALAGAGVTIWTRIQRHRKAIG